MHSSTIPDTQVQEVTSAHPSGFDKWIWTGEISNGRGLSRGAVATALRLAHHHNADTGQCNPSLKTIADALKTSVPTIKRDLTELKAAGYVSWKVTKNNRNNRYTLKHVRIGNHHGSTATKPSPAKYQKAKSKGPASSAKGNVVQFPEPKAVSDPAQIIRSVVVSFPGSVPQMSPPDSSPVSPPDSSPVSHKPMKDNRQGYPEEVEGKQDNEETSKALDGPVAPFRPDGHQESQDSADAKQPDKQPEVETRPADGKLSFDQIATPEWIEQQLDYAASSEAYHSGSGRTPNDPSVAKELLQRFRELTTRAGIREAEGRWNDMWVSFYNQKRPSEPTAKPTKKKRTGMAL